MDCNSIVQNDHEMARPDRAHCIRDAALAFLLLDAAEVGDRVEWPAVRNHFVWIRAAVAGDVSQDVALPYIVERQGTVGHVRINPTLTVLEQ